VKDWRSDLVSHNLDSGFAAFLSDRVDLRHYVFAGEQDGNGIPDLREPVTEEAREAQKVGTLTKFISWPTRDLGFSP
jgi:hypothetical protein